MTEGALGTLSFVLLYHIALSPTHFVGAPSRKGPCADIVLSFFLIGIAFTKPRDYRMVFEIQQITVE